MALRHNDTGLGNAGTPRLHSLYYYDWFDTKPVQY
jgi:hypothetical protein